MDEEAIIKLTDESQQLALLIITTMVTKEDELSDFVRKEISEFVGLEMPEDMTQILRSYLLANALASFTVSALKLTSHFSGANEVDLMKILALSRQQGLQED